MNPRMRRVLILTALALLLIAAVNGFVFWNVARNRAGEPEAELLLSGREFYPWLSRNAENSGRFLRLRYQRVYNTQGFDNPWLDLEKLKSLGYQVPRKLLEGDEIYPGRTPARNVFVVLEFNGPAYEQYVAQAAAEVERLRASEDKERLSVAEAELREARNEDSRLFVVDAGRDAQALRQGYANRQQYLIVPGEVRIRWKRDWKPGEARFDSSIALKLEEIFVPLAFAGEFAKVVQQIENERPRKNNASPKFQLRLAFGRHLEPWIKEMRAGQPNP